MIFDKGTKGYIEQGLVEQAMSIKEDRCSSCIQFRHDARAKKSGNSPINWCLLYVSKYRREKLAYGDDLVACENHRTEIEVKLEKKGW